MLGLIWYKPNEEVVQKVVSTIGINATKPDEGKGSCKFS